MKKILVIRFSSIGDIILTTPVVRCLKEQTEAEIHYITKRPYASMLESNPNVDKVYAIEKEITELIDELKAENYDFIVDLHNNLRSVRLKKALRKPSAAFPKLNKQKWLLTNFKWDMMPNVHVVDRYFEAVRGLDVKNDMKGLDYFIPQQNEVDLQAWNIPEEYVVFSIGAKFATKRMWNTQIIEIIKHIELPVVLIGGQEDSDNGDVIELQCQEIINCVGELSLDQSASVIKRAKKIVTHDTGMMHIASAFQKPIISVWGNTVPALGMYPYMPQNQERSIMHEVDIKCRPCSKIGYQKCPKKHFRCMENQDTTAIAASVNS